MSRQQAVAALGHPELNGAVHVGQQEAGGDVAASLSPRLAAPHERVRPPAGFYWLPHARFTAGNVGEGYRSEAARASTNGCRESLSSVVRGWSLYTPSTYLSNTRTSRGYLRRTLPASQSSTVVLSSPSLRASSRCEIPSRRRAALIRSPRVVGSGLGSYPRKRITAGTKRTSGAYLPCSHYS